ncbi:MAG: DUF211 domain-containing protein [Candidatus Micrarchaeota archaeon]|nr:DUF211 domain-containing protein [Candidatus Micrarchaeota archaeon]
MTGLRKIVLDVLKPSEPSVIEISRKLSEVEGVDGVELDVQEVDRKVETVKVTIEGTNMKFDKINAVLEKYGAVVHSIDKACSGKKIVGA